MKIKNSNTVNKSHSFSVQDAIGHGIEKAAIIHNFSFWLDYNRANNKNLHDGYYWTYNTAEALAELMPYITSTKMARLLRELAKDGIILVGNYNKKGYDRTKWYSMPCYASLFNSEQCNVQITTMDSSELNNALFNSEQAIPDINTDINQMVNTDINTVDIKDKKVTSKSYKPEKPKSVSDQIWNDLLILRKDKKTSNTQTAWTTIFNGLAKAQQETGHTLDQIIAFWILKEWKGFNADWYLNAQPKQQTNNKGINNGQSQAASQQTSKSDAYRQSLRGISDTSTVRTVKRSVN